MASELLDLQRRGAVPRVLRQQHAALGGNRIMQERSEEPIYSPEPSSLPSPELDEDPVLVMAVTTMAQASI